MVDQETQQRGHALPSQSMELQFGWARRLGVRPSHSTHTNQGSGYQLLMLLDEEMDVRFHERTWHMKPGMVLLSPPGAAYAFVNTRWAHLAAVSFRVLLQGNLDITSDLSPMRIWEPRGDEVERLKVLFAILIADGVTTSPDAGQYVKEGILFTLFGLCWEVLGAETAMTMGKSVLPNWLAYSLQEIRHYPRMTVNDLARLVGYSPSRYRALFHRHMGIPPQEYLQRVRLEVAQRLLETTELSIRQIAEQVGFENQSHFTRFFVHRTGMTPLRYRNPAGSCPSVARPASSFGA